MSGLLVNDVWQVPYRDVAEQCEHGSAERSPVFLVAVFARSEEVISHDGEDEHHQK